MTNCGYQRCSDDKNITLQFAVTIAVTDSIRAVVEYSNTKIVFNSCWYYL